MVAIHVTANRMRESALKIVMETIRMGFFLCRLVLRIR
jgi:hypothetical protein